MSKLFVEPIGEVAVNEEGMFININKAYIPALKELDGFSHINVFWWFDGCDNVESRSVLEVKKPYKKSPETVGIFATRSPNRPNPIALTCVYVTYIDHENGIIGLGYIDADDKTPVIDIKPYTPSFDRVESPKMPQWCAHWPKCAEESGDFDWSDEFNF